MPQSSRFKVQSSKSKFTVEVQSLRFKVQSSKSKYQDREDDFEFHRIWSNFPCQVYTKPRFAEEKRPRFGKTVLRFPLSTPNQVANVAKY